MYIRQLKVECITIKNIVSLGKYAAVWPPWSYTSSFAALTQQLQRVTLGAHMWVSHPMPSRSLGFIYIPGFSEQQVIDSQEHLTFYIWHESECWNGKNSFSVIFELLEMKVWHTDYSLEPYQCADALLLAKGTWSIPEQCRKLPLYA